MMPPTCRAKRSVIGAPVVSNAVFQFMRASARTSVAARRISVAFDPSVAKLDLFLEARIHALKDCVDEAPGIQKTDELGINIDP